MKRKTLRLRSVPAFDAAARHLSFKLAAEELHVTSGAVSRQVAALEKSLGTKLFRRMTRRIELTDAGIAYHRAVEHALATLLTATENLAGDAAVTTLTLSALPTIASVWLMPRLHLFTRANPQVEVRITTSIEPANLREDRIDLAIRVGRLPKQSFDADHPRIDLTMLSDWSGIQAEELFPDVLVPVCGQALLANGPPIQSVADLLQFPLIHLRGRRHAWPDWLKAQGLTLDPNAHALEFGHFFMAIESARMGEGIALVPSAILVNYEFRDSLVALFTRDIPSAGAYYLLTTERNSENPRCKALASWLKAEAVNVRNKLAHFEEAFPRHNPIPA